MRVFFLFSPPSFFRLFLFSVHFFRRIGKNQTIRNVIWLDDLYFVCALSLDHRRVYRFSLSFSHSPNEDSFSIDASRWLLLLLLLWWWVLLFGVAASCEERFEWWDRWLADGGNPYMFKPAKRCVKEDEIDEIPVTNGDGIEHLEEPFSPFFKF